MKNTLNRLVNSKAGLNKVVDVDIVKNYNEEFERNLNSKFCSTCMYSFFNKR